MTIDGPTRGASDSAQDSQWVPSPRLALLVRVSVSLIPACGAFVALHLVVDLLYRPPGTLGLLAWFAQGFVVGTTISVFLDRWARRLLPLVTLLKMSMVFPDEAPSRFAVALRAGSFRRMQQQVTKANRDGLGATAAEAAVQAIELVTVLSSHDRLTRGHTERVRAYADIIGVEMGLSNDERAKLAWGVMLHDIGKVTVPPDVLNKSDPLTATEWAVLKTHPEAGGRLLAPLHDWLGPWARAAAEHHERWDGGGYPVGLAGEEISLAGRITAVADAYDVITSTRSYKKPMSVEAARRELVDCAGSQFDPAVVRAFLNVSLGRRWTTGLLATLSNLPMANLTSAPAVVTAGIAATAASLVAVIPEPEIPDLLAFEDVVVVEESTTTSVTTAAAIQGPLARFAAATTATTEALAESTTSSPPGSTTTPGSTLATTAATGAATTPTSVLSGTPSTATSSRDRSPSNSPTTATTSPTTASTTATTARTTTSTSTTTASTSTSTALTTTASTSTAPTTTSAAPAATVLFLKNPGTGDTTARLNKTLASAGPDNPSLPNYNTNQDSRPGSRFRPTGIGFGETNPDRIEGFFFTPDSATLSGPTTFTVWLAIDSDLGGASAVVDADIARCRFLMPCTTIAADSATVSTWIGDGFQSVTFDFGSPTQTFGPGETLTIRLITTGTESIHVGFDADPTPSRLETTLS